MWGHMSTTGLPGSSRLAGRYRLVERLGAGGMSVVWRGFDEVLGRQVAVKVLPPSTSADPSFRRRLRAEAQAAARLGHPNITNVYDYGEATTVDGEPVPYVVMELVDGESLAAVLARERRLPWPAAVRICADVSAALAAAHSRGIVHRDVTPANVMLTAAGAKVVDFGISALIGENDIDPDGSLLGTPAYLAPERLEGGQVSPATDVYAVGLLIYRTLIGALPWDVGTTTALLRAHQYIEPEPLPYVDGLPPAVAALVGCCLEKRPDDRPSSAELAHVLAQVSAGAPGAPTFVPDLADSGEDTTILPSARGDTDGFARVRPGHAKVADATPVRTGRGVAAVPAGSAPGAGSVAASLAGGSGSAFAGAGSIGAGSAEAGSVLAPSAASPGGPSPSARSDGADDLAGASLPPAAGPAVAQLAAAVGGVAAPAGLAARSAPAAFVPAPPPLGVVPPAPRTGPPIARNSRFGAVPRPAGAADGPPAEDHAAPGAHVRSAFAADAPERPVAPAQRPSGPGERATGPGRGGRTRGGDHRRRAAFAAGAIALAALGGYGFSLARHDGGADNQAQARGPLPIQVAGSDKCLVSYRVDADSGNYFKATVMVANRDTAALKSWQLWFAMPGTQVMSGNGRVHLRQQARDVYVDGTGLAAQRTATIKVTGRHAPGQNPAPQMFQLAGQTCQAFVSDEPGAPARQVEHLSDGTTRLGRVPAPGVPAPGISVDPGGNVRVPPSASAPAGPTGGGHPQPSGSSPTTTSTAPPPKPPDPQDGGSSTPTATATTQTPPAGQPPPADCDPADPTCSAGP
jgi:eukaryotic-like serine/threonine-protein kinase